MSFVSKSAALGAAALMLAALMPGQGFAADDPVEFRISLETGPNHSRNKSIEKFVQALNEKTGGKLKAEIYHGGALFKGRDIPKALAQGTIDMSAPGTWQLSTFVPDADLTALPAFYGLDRERVYEIVDGPIGQDLNQRIEDKLKVKILGGWLDLGYVHTYSTGKKIESFEDMKGLKVRFPGGTVNSERYKHFGANTVLIPWPDVPLALIQGTVDGVQTSNESIRSAKLWESGLKYAFEDKQVLFQYVPVVSGRFWNKLDEELQQVILDTWQESIGEMRDYAHQRQDDARAEAAENGMEFVTPSAEALAEARQGLLSTQDAIVEDLKMDPDLAKRATEALSDAS